MKKAITYTITIDERTGTTEARDMRSKMPLSTVWSTDPASVAGIYRDLAFYLLETAHGIEHSGEFMPPMFTSKEAEKYAAMMLQEHKSIFEETEDLTA